MVMCGKADGPVIFGGAFDVAVSLAVDESDESPAATSWFAGLGATGPEGFSRPKTRMTSKAMIAAASRWRCGICFNLAMRALIRSLVRSFIEVLLIRFRRDCFRVVPVNSNQSASS